MNIRNRLSLATIILFMAILAVNNLLPQKDYPTNKSGPEINFVVENGEFGSAIATKLVTSGVIKSADVFIEEFISNPKAQGISAGVHRIESKVPATVAIEQLLDPKRLVNQVIIREGTNLGDVIKVLKKSENIDAEEFSRESLQLVSPLFPELSKSLEGSLYPAHYSFAPGTSLISALEQMVAKAKSVASFSGLDIGFEDYNAYEVLTIASMVQVEGDPTNFEKVARVIYNRLKIGMPLQLNATVQYASNKRGEILVTNEDTKIISPYNTYRVVGLPPTPISNPGSAAISASLKPASGSWIYFITVAPGDTRFTSDFEEFSGWNMEFNRNVAAGVFK
jgi:UPF0755 protein